MAVNIHNYEAFFLDFHEGNLGEEDRLALMAFLEMHPELKDEFDNFDSISIKPDAQVSFAGKNMLKKQDRENKKTLSDELLIALLEGDLQAAEKQELEAALEYDNEARLRIEHYRQTISLPDPQIAFPRKDLLRKKTALPLISRREYAYAAAALIIVLLGISALLLPGTHSTPAREDLAMDKASPVRASIIGQQPTMATLSMRPGMQPRITRMEREHIEIARTGSRMAHNIESFSLYNHSFLAYYRPVPGPLYENNSYDEFLATTDPLKEKTLTGKIIGNFFKRVKAPFVSENAGKEKNKGNFSFWDLAELGVKGVNALGDHDYTLVKQYNENGNVKGLLLLEE